MPRLEDLQKTLSEMSPDELRDRIRQIRTERRIYKEPRRVKKARVSAAEQNKAKLGQLLDQLSPEEKERFLQDMEPEP